MKVSIIIPIYNKEPYIERCINSVLNQTYRQLEVILVNDCTLDNSMYVARKVIEESGTSEDLEFLFLNHDRNRGLSEARNTGIRAASGEYLFFLDSDDALTPQCISLMVEQVRLHPYIELVQGYTVSVPDKAHYNTDELNHLGYRESNMIYTYEINRISNFPITAWNKLVKRDFIVCNNLFFMEGIIHEDHHWMFYLAECISKFAFISEITYIRYYTPNSIMTALNNKESCACMAKILYNVVPKVDYPCRHSKLNYMIRLFLNGYLRRGGNSEKNRLERLLVTRILKEGMPKGALLLFCTVHLSTIKGGWRFKKWLNQYLDKQSAKDLIDINANLCSKMKEH